MVSLRRGCAGGRRSAGRRGGGRPLLLEEAGEEGLGVAYGVSADPALFGVDREHELAAPGRAAVAGVHLARLEAEEVADERPGRNSIMRTMEDPL